MSVYLALYFVYLPSWLIKISIMHYIITIITTLVYISIQTWQQDYCKKL